MTSAITSNQSRDVRDAFAKGIYGRLFIHIVKVGSICQYGKAQILKLSSRFIDL